MKETLERMLTRHEGLRLKPYRCTAGKLTIGIGRNIEDVGIFPDEAALMLRNDIARCERDLDHSVPWWRKLDEVRRWVLIDMCFMGIGKLMEFKKMWTALAVRDYEAAAAEMLDSLWARQVGSRAKELAEMMKGGGL